MKHDPQFHEPRSSVVFRYTTDAIRNSSHTDTSLAQAIAEQYMAEVAPGERILQFHTGSDADSVERAIKANGQIIARIRNGTVKMPVDLEESWTREQQQQAERLDAAAAAASAQVMAALEPIRPPAEIKPRAKVSWKGRLRPSNADFSRV
ncbi:hypothetical protein [Stenotrophomonas sp.]|uniref:hypothetical protein n=1 Tax=Stenotrophomonas sp. TaxID=69392 RepID=UPI00289C6BB9|nr:hypothetical protein [Stenotrophomonas sp.]